MVVPRHTKMVDVAVPCTSNRGAPLLQEAKYGASVTFVTH